VTAFKIELVGRPWFGATRLPPHQFRKTVSFPTKKLWKDAAFLHEKYVVEGRTPAEIADLTLSSKKTVFRYLRLHGAVLHTEDTRSSGPLPYGKRWVKRRETPYKKEQYTVQKIEELKMPPPPPVRHHFVRMLTAGTRF